MKSIGGPILFLLAVAALAFVSLLLSLVLWLFRR